MWNGSLCMAAEGVLPYMCFLWTCCQRHENRQIFPDRLSNCKYRKKSEKCNAEQYNAGKLKDVLYSCLKAPNTLFRNHTPGYRSLTFILPKWRDELKHCSVTESFSCLWLTESVFTLYNVRVALAGLIAYFPVHYDRLSYDGSHGFSFN